MSSRPPFPQADFQENREQPAALEGESGELRPPLRPGGKGMAELDQRHLCARTPCSECPALGVRTVLPTAKLLSDHRTPGNKALTTPCTAGGTCVYVKIRKHASPSGQSSSPGRKPPAYLFSRQASGPSSHIYRVAKCRHRLLTGYLPPVRNVLPLIAASFRDLGHRASGS